MKKKIVTRLILLVIMACLTIPAAYAYMYMRTNVLDNQFEIAEADAEVVEVMDQNTKKSVKIQNTGNIDSYIRLIIFTYWEDSKGNVVGRQDTTKVNNGNPVMNFNYDTENWIQDGNIYYCKTPIKVGELTPELFESGSSITLQKIEENVTSNGVTVTYEYFQVVEIIAEAIQSNPVDAVRESWKVVLDTDDKTIKSVN